MTQPAPRFFPDAAPLTGLAPASLRLRLWPQTLQLAALPAAYVAVLTLLLIGIVAYAVGFADSLRTPPLFFALPVYLLPLLAGLGLFAMLLRPLLPLRTQTEASVPLDLAREPALAQLLDELCAKLGATAPAGVHADLGSAVSLQLLPGRDGWQRGHYTLHIGLPLLQCAPLPVLAAELASALVFAREPSLLRLYILVGRLRGWLDDRAQPREDRLSARLAALPDRPRRWLQAADQRLLRELARLYAGVGQRAPRAAEATLLQIGDRAGCAVAGGSSVEQRLHTAYRLDRARQRALAKNTERRIDTRLSDDLPALIGFYFDHPDTDHEKQLAREKEIGVAALHPAADDRQRLAWAQTCIASAPTLSGQLALADNTLPQRCTEAFYAAQGIPVQPRLAAEHLLDEALLDLEQQEAGALYFNRWLVPARGWRLPDAALLRELSHADAREQLNVCVNEVRRLTPDRARLLAEFARLQAQLQELLLGQQVLAAQHRFVFRYIKHDGASLVPLIEQRQRELAKIQEQLATQESIMGGRLALGLKLFGQGSADSEALHRTLDFLGEQEKMLYRLEQDTTLLEQLLQRQHERKERGYGDAIARLAAKVRDATLRLLDRLRDAPNPPDRRYAPLRDFFHTAHSPQNNAAANAAHARAVLEGFYTLNEKLSLLAAEQASSVEEAYKIERIRLIDSDRTNLSSPAGPAAPNTERADRA